MLGLKEYEEKNTFFSHVWICGIFVSLIKKLPERTASCASVLFIISPDRQFSALPKFGSIIKCIIMPMSCGINEMCAQLLVS